MNIFYLHPDPKVCALWLCDKHVTKMATEGCQMLANCYPKHMLKVAPRTVEGTVRKYSWSHHKSAKWVKESIYHFEWLLAHTIELIFEKKVRYPHKPLSETNYKFAEWCLDNYPDLSDTPFVPPPASIKDYPVYDDILYTYRQYYIEDKKRFATWTNREIPSWYKESV